MIDFVQIMHFAYRGLFSFVNACKLESAIKDWPSPDLEALVYAKRFRFLQDAYRYINYENYKDQIEAFTSQYQTSESCMQEAKTCFTAATKKLQSLMALDQSLRNVAM